MKPQQQTQGSLSGVLKETILRMKLHGKAPSIIRSAEALLQAVESRKKDENHATNKRQASDKLETA